jgi:hypothetical protein
LLGCRWPNVRSGVWRGFHFNVRGNFAVCPEVVGIRRRFFSDNDLTAYRKSAESLYIRMTKRRALLSTMRQSP